MFTINNGALTGYTGKNKNITIPDGVVSIEDDVFERRRRIESVIIPDSVISIGRYAFFDCEGITNVTIGSGVKGIGSNAFEGCYRLKSITIPGSVKDIGNFAFSYCTRLTSVTISNGVKRIGDYAFETCWLIKSITIPDSVTSIGSHAFYNCLELKTKKSIYKAFYLDYNNDKLFCKGYEFKVNTWSRKIKDISMCNKGYHYCENLFDVFNYYHGEIDKDIAIYECEARGISEATHSDSKKVCQQIKPVKRLYRKDVIRILNESSHR